MWLIHRREECVFSKVGLNYTGPNVSTVFNLLLRIPFRFIKKVSKVYVDFETDEVRYNVVMCRELKAWFRLRRYQLPIFGYAWLWRVEKEE